MSDTIHSVPTDSERPPFGGWPRLYAVVAANLALLILLFSLFSRVFR